MDVDIDVPATFNSLKVFPNWVRASILKDGKLTPHPCGVYPQDISQDPLTKLSAIPYDAAEDLGYLKVDFLHVNVYKHFKSREEINLLLKKEPNWKLLQLPVVHPKLFQLAKHGELLMDIKPTSIVELADIMALIRPGKKAFINLYKKNKESTRKVLFAKDDSGYSFKKSHALAYSYVVHLQLHLIQQGKI